MFSRKSTTEAGNQSVQQEVQGRYLDRSSLRDLLERLFPSQRDFKIQLQNDIWRFTAPRLRPANPFYFQKQKVRNHVRPKPELAALPPSTPVGKAAAAAEQRFPTRIGGRRIVEWLVAVEARRS
ncbi:hypothetical protein XA68_15199 [Ophiocordyceps unilateralis]|uniref:Uncharacterized protein n=1 Tax=Ophiocordyceps unilateralis TaxID=268505 RepID=A0A2A9P8X7_OPHUN|nr:hypothetical protein XA68_15199 [Ophiocordyceps unilateralis]